MSGSQNRNSRMVWLGFSFLVATFTLSVHAAQPKPKADPKAAEAKQAADEDAKEAAEGETGKQRSFIGAFSIMPEPDPSQNISPEVVGTFLTAAADARPNRTYLVKVENGSKGIVEALKRNSGKNVRVTGKLRNYGEDGEAKYLIVSTVIEASTTPRSGERRKTGGI